MMREGEAEPKRMRCEQPEAQPPAQSGAGSEACCGGLGASIQCDYTKNIRKITSNSEWEKASERRSNRALQRGRERILRKACAESG